MKQIGSIILAVILFTSCGGGSHKERIISSDTVRHMMVLKQDQSIMYFSKAILVVGEYRGIPKDSTSSSVEWHLDTVVTQAFAPKDTARDAQHKPIYDTATKRYKMDSAWQPIPPYDPKTVKIRYFK